MATFVPLILLAILALFVFIVAVASIRIVQPYQKGVVERLGRYQRTAQPGLTLIVPFIDSIKKDRKSVV